MLLKKNLDSNSTTNASLDINSKMTTCTNCGPDPPPIKIQNITLWDESKKAVFSINNSEISPTESSQDIEMDAKKIQEVLNKTLFYSDAKKLESKPNRTRRSVPRKTEVTLTPKTSVSTPILLSKFDGSKIDIIPLHIDASDSNLMTQAIMKDRAREDNPRLDRVAQIVTNIVHSPRALSYGRVAYPYDSSLTSTRQSSQPYGVPHSKLIIRPTRFRSQYRFPPEPVYYQGSPYSDHYSGSNPTRPRKSKKLPAKLIDVHDNHDTQYEYVEMEVNHEGKQVPKKPPKYMRGRQKGHSQHHGYSGYNDYYKKPSRPYKKGSSKAYNPKTTYNYDEENDRGEGYDYHDTFDSKRSPDYDESAEGGGYNSQEGDRDGPGSGENYKSAGPDPSSYGGYSKSKKSNFVPSQPVASGHYYQPPAEGPGRPPHKFIPVPKTLEEYHQLHGTKFLNSYKPEEDNEFTYHYPNDNHGDGHYDEEEESANSNPRPYNPPKQFKKLPRPTFDEYSNPGFQEFSKPSYSPDLQGGKTPTSFMSVVYGKADPEIQAETRYRAPTPGRKSKYSQPLPSNDPDESGAASNDELSSKELQTFLDQVKSHVYDEDGGLKSHLKTDLQSGLHSSHFEASLDPYSNSNSRKKAKKGYHSNAKDLLENTRGNYNKKHNYRNKNNYFASGNSDSSYNRGTSHSGKKNGWKGAGDSGFGYKESNRQDSFDGDLFDKDGAPEGFKRDLFGKDRLSLIPSGSNREVARENPGRGARRVKIRVTKMNQVLEENETLVKPVVAVQGTTTEASFTNVTAANGAARNATSN